MKSVFIGLSCIYVAAVLSCISGVPVVKRSVFSCEGRDNGNYPNPSDCEKFVTCSNGQTFNMNCPANLHYNRVTGQCDFPANANCNPLAGFCDDKVAGDYSHPSNCTLYISCAPGHSPFVRSCPENLHFNQTANECQFPDKAGCQS